MRMALPASAVEGAVAEVTTRSADFEVIKIGATFEERVVIVIKFKDFVSTVCDSK